MGYVGNEPSVNFTSFAKQDITGDGGASYTLTHAVANANEIEVFVNNVRQEPTSAYTVSGTALTMTGNVASTDDFYVIYLGKALQTTTPPDGSVTSAKLDTNIAIDGDLTVDTNTLYVDSTNNRVGVGTVSPAQTLHVSGGTDTRIRTEESGGSLFDITITNSGHFVDSTSTGDLTINKIGSANMVFKTNNSERMRIDSSGIVNINCTTQQIVTNERLRLVGKAAFTTSGDAALNLNRDSDNGGTLRFHRGTTQVGEISVTTSSTNYGTSSDHRLKENVTADWDATTRLKQLNPVRFNFIADADTTVDGFLAHEVQSVVPEAVTGTHNEVDDDGNPVYQGIDQSKLVPLLVKTIQELEARITALENS
jgi:cytoskeletal protein CcmA (bactofilin family)